ncbi:MAG: acylphosphatase [Ferruginibacter sp.]
MPTFHLLIKGKVQGVFYRASTKKAAITFSITGWVRNKENGDVEALATGTSIQLKKFVNWCRQGPAGAQVNELIETEKEEIKFDSFTIKH